METIKETTSIKEMERLSHLLVEPFREERPWISPRLLVANHCKKMAAFQEQPPCIPKTSVWQDSDNGVKKCILLVANHCKKMAAFQEQPPCIRKTSFGQDSDNGVKEGTNLNCDVTQKILGRVRPSDLKQISLVSKSFRQLITEKVFKVTYLHNLPKIVICFTAISLYLVDISSYRDATVKECTKLRAEPVKFLERRKNDREWSFMIGSTEGCIGIVDKRNKGHLVDILTESCHSIEGYEFRSGDRLFGMVETERDVQVVVLDSREVRVYSRNKKFWRSFESPVNIYRTPPYGIIGRSPTGTGEIYWLLRGSFMKVDVRTNSISVLPIHLNGENILLHRLCCRGPDLFAFPVNPHHSKHFFAYERSTNTWVRRQLDINLRCKKQMESVSDCIFWQSSRIYELTGEQMKAGIAGNLRQGLRGAALLSKAPFWHFFQQ